MERHHIARIYWGIIIGVVILTGLQLFTAFQPYTFVASNVQNLMGVNVNYNIPTTLHPFYYSSLDVVNAPTISCTLSTAFYGLTDTNQIVPLSVESIDASPIRTAFDLTGGVGQSFTTFSVREMMTCPTTVSGYPPTLVSGTSTLVWTATKQDGTTVTILNSQQNIQPTANGQAIALPSSMQSYPTVTLYTWTVSKSQIENALGVNGLGGANFNSLQNISVSNTITFYQGNVQSVPWTFYNAGPTMISYTLHETTPPALAFNNLNMTLNVISPSNKQVNLQTNPKVTVQGYIANWQPSQGYPELKILYNNPSGAGTSLAGDFFLQPDNPSQESGGQTFTFTYAFASQTSGTGQYIFGFHFAGNADVPQDTVYVTNTQVSCPTGQYLDGATNQCKVISTTNCGNGIVVISGTQCPAPPNPPAPNPSNNSCPSNIFACMQNANWTSLFQTGQQAIGLAFVLVGILIFILVISGIWHTYHKKEGNEEMMIPTPVEMVRE